MKRVGVVFHSGFGNTARVADAVARGAESVAGIDAVRLEIDGKAITAGRFENETLMAQLDGCDAIVFGAPTYMGSVSGPFKCFADATAPFWFDQRWKDKIAGGFTSSGYASGDKVMTLHYLATLAAQLRMVWVGPDAPPSNVTGDGREIDQWGFYLGVGVRGNLDRPDEPTHGDILTAELYGARIAKASLRWDSVAERSLSAPSGSPA